MNCKQNPTVTALFIASFVGTGFGQTPATILSVDLENIVEDGEGGDEEDDAKKGTHG